MNKEPAEKYNIIEQRLHRKKGPTGRAFAGWIIEERGKKRVKERWQGRMRLHDERKRGAWKTVGTKEGCTPPKS